MGKVLKFSMIPLILILAILVLIPFSSELQTASNSIRDANLYYSEVDGVMDYSKVKEISPIILDGDYEIYWGENENIGENIYLSTYSELMWLVDTNQLNTHAIDKHGMKALIVIKCINGNGGILSIRNPETGRKAVICTIKTTDKYYEKYNGKFGVAIFEEGKSTVSAFIKESLSKIEQVCKYLYNRGYTDGNPWTPIQ